MSFRVAISGFSPLSRSLAISRKSLSRNFRFALAALCLVPFSAQAQAGPIGLILPQATVALLASVPASSTCFHFEYDENGNRLASSSSGINSASATWGSSTFGCSFWGQ